MNHAAAPLFAMLLALIAQDPPPDPAIRISIRATPICCGPGSRSQSWVVDCGAGKDTASARFVTALGKPEDGEREGTLSRRELADAVAAWKRDGLFELKGETRNPEEPDCACCKTLTDVEVAAGTDLVNFSYRRHAHGGSQADLRKMTDAITSLVEKHATKKVAKQEKK